MEEFFKELATKGYSISSRGEGFAVIQIMDSDIRIHRENLTWKDAIAYVTEHVGRWQKPDSERKYWMAQAIHNQGFGYEFESFVVEAGNPQKAQQKAETFATKRFTEKYRNSHTWEEVRIRPIDTTSINELKKSGEWNPI